MVTFNSRTGCIETPFPSLAGGRVAVRLDDLTLVSDRLDWTPDGDGFRAERDGIRLHIACGDAIRLTIANERPMPARLGEVRFTWRSNEGQAAWQADEFLELIHPINFESLPGVKRVGLPGRAIKPDAFSHWVYALRHRSTGQSYVFGALPPHEGDFIAFRALHEQAHLEGAFGLEIRSEQERTIAPGGTARVSAIEWTTGSDPAQLLIDFGRRWAGERPRPAKPRRLGWNSWDFFASSVSGDDVFENVAIMRELLPDAPLDIVIDDGWQRQWGEWEPNERFPGGVETFCRQVREQGGRPGLWLAPLIVNVYTRVFRDHPHWFARGADGQIVEGTYSKGPAGFLDPTHPEVAIHLAGIFGRLRRAGVETFKVDFTQEVLRASRFHDSSVPRGGIIRRTFEIIREAIGPEAYLLACGAPYECVTGLVDAVRVTGDIHNHWSHVLMAAHACAARFWMHDAMWNSDPDFLIVRTSANSPGVRLNRLRAAKPHEYGQTWLSGREFNDQEAQAYALLVLLSGGDLMLGDHLPALIDSAKALLKRVVELRPPQAAVPLDLFDRHDQLPRLWLARGPEHDLIGVFNWDDDLAVGEVDLATLGIGLPARISDIWTGRAIPLVGARVPYRLAARESMGWKLDRSSR